MLCVVAGFGLGFITSLPIAFLMAWYQPVQKIIEPWINFIRNIPALGYAPLLVLIFGIGQKPAIILIWICTFMTMSITIYQGIKNIDVTLIKAARVLGANDFDIFMKIICPATVPFIITAVRLGLGAALTTLLAAESTGAQFGIGMRIRSLSNSFESAPMLMYIILLGIIGLLLVKSGQLRACILSDEGREITIYRLFDRDICLFSASCLLRSAQFNITIEAEKDTSLWVIPAEVYRDIMEASAAAANYTNEIMAARFSEVMWLVEQVMWKSMDKRVAAFLVEEAAIEKTDRLSITHETIANHLGTHREVVTRMLRYLQGEGMVRLSRGVVELLDEKKLTALRDA